jgi:hypothetical protein
VVVQIGMLAGILDIVAFGGFHRYTLVLASRFVLGLFASVNVGVRSMGGDVKAVSEKVCRNFLDLSLLCPSQPSSCGL